MAMDRTCEGNETLQLLPEPGITPVVPSKVHWLVKWDYDVTIYKRRNEVEGVFRRLKGCRRILSRFEKFEVMYRACLKFALIVDRIKC